MSQFIVLNGDYYTGHNTDLNVLTFEHNREKAQPLSKLALKNVLRVILSWIAEDTIELKRLEILTINGETEGSAND